MRKNLGPALLMYPQTVFIIASYDENGVANALTAGGGICDMTHVALILYKEHKTVKNILTTGAFTVSTIVADYVTECDYLGIASGSKIPNKIEKVGFHTSRSEFVNAPIIDELPVTLECKLTSYDEETGQMIGEIINATIDERVIGENGKVSLEKLRPVVLDNDSHAYLEVGKKIATAYKDGKKFI